MLLCTLPENERFLGPMLGVTAQRWEPACPTLGYQFVTFTNYQSARLQKDNGEVR